MTSLEESDQVTYSFLFIITPLEIISTKSIKNLKKSLLLKLGNRTEKTSQLNKPIEIPVEVLYSKTLKKYCPIKGIIKVYDINLDGSEVISSVGGFQTQQILNQHKSNVLIERDVGTSKIKMKIEIKNLGVIKGKPQSAQKETFLKRQEPKYTLSRSRTRQNAPQVPLNNLQKSRLIQPNIHTPQLLEDETKKINQYFRRSIPTSNASSIELPGKLIDMNKRTPDMVKSQLKVANSMNDRDASFQVSSRRESIFSQSVFTESSMGQRQNQKPGHILVEQDTNTVMIQKQFVQYKQQINELKQQLTQSQKRVEELICHFRKILQGLQTRNGKIRLQNNEKDKILTLKYKDKNYDKTFSSFLEFMESEVEKPINQRVLLDEEEANNRPSILNDEKVKKRIQLLNEELSEKTKQIFTLRAKQREQGSLQIRIKSKQRQFTQLENRIKQNQILKRSLKQENTYLKQKDQTMQQIITEKQNQIENLKQQITEIQLQFKEMEATLKNDACLIQELKQEVSNLNQTIDTYREKYGDLKNVKNRALQNQLKECLIWIDQQTRQLQMSDFAQQTEPSHSHNVSEIIKNIQLQGASRQQMNSIKVELAGLIKRIDNFLSK